MKKINLIVDEDNTDIRLDMYLRSNTPFSRTYIQKLIDQNLVKVNNELVKKKYLTKTNDNIEIEYEEKENVDLVAKDIPLDIVYEDDDLIVINKQKGLVVHPAPGNYDNTLVNALLYREKELSDVNGYYRPGIVHRIDKDTSGLLVVCKNNFSHNSIAKQLSDKTCFRKYYAIVSGVIENDEGEINAPIGRSKRDRQKMEVTDINSKDAITFFKVIDRFADMTLLDLELKTGRTHQIRVHMKFINHPVVNDEKYGKKIIDNSGQYLHAYYLSFIHPRTNERMEFSIPIPEYMKTFIINNGGKYI